MNLRVRYVFTSDVVYSETTNDFLSFLEFRAPEVDDGSSCDRSEKWTNIDNIWWVEVHEKFLFIGIVLVVQSKFNGNIRKLLWIWWGKALCFCL